MSLLVAVPSAGAEKEFRILDVVPNNKTADVELDPLIQIHVSDKFDPSTISRESVRLLGRGGKAVPITVGGDLGGVITASVDKPLEPGQEYQLVVTASLCSADGTPIKPLSIKFNTTSRKPGPPRADIADFRFKKTLIEGRDGVCGLALAPGHVLFACTWDGKLVRFALREDGSAAAGDVVLERGRRFNAIVADLASTREKTVLWLSHDSQQRLSVGPNDFSGTIARVTVENGQARLEDRITGLPTGDHPASGLTFGPDGRLYVSQGALSMLGGKPGAPETPLSAATLAIDLRHELWDRAPVDVSQFDRTTRPDAIEVFATGIREAYDLLWHSGGSLFAGVNMNDTSDSTPARPGLPAVSVRPGEMMLRIVRGKYYGHPNPSRNEWVLLGGNPTDGADPWEISQLPVGTRPEANFDPSLLIRNLEQDKGPSANGSCEWLGDGPLKGRLLFCFYTATRGIQSYQLTGDGRGVTDPQALVDSGNRTLRFGAPLDVVYDERGWLYVADFSAPERGDSGRAGGIWRVHRDSAREPSR